MAQVVTRTKPTKLRFLMVGPNEKMLRSLIYQGGHQHTVRWDKEFDALLFYGDAKDGDVAPFLYGEKIVGETSPNFELDRQWIKAFHAVEPFFPKIGIGRGAHFLNVMSGGSLWQRFDNHHDYKIGHVVHDIKELSSGNLVKVASSHTQGMVVGSAGVMLAVANESTRRENMEEVNNEASDWHDPEIVHYWNTNSLCIQGHPEKYIGGTTTDKAFQSMFFDYVEHYPFTDHA